MRRKSAGKPTLTKHRKAVQKKLLSINSFLDSLPDTIIFSLDTQYQYTAFSEAHAVTMKKIWGVSIAKGMNMLEAISAKKDKTKAKKNFDKALKGQHFVRREDYGDPHHFRTSYEDRYGPIKNKSGKITGLYVWVVDLTAYRKTEAEVKHYGALLSSSLESVNHGILVVDLKEQVIFRNQKFLELWRVSPEIAKTDDDWKILGHALKLVADPEIFLARVKKLYQNPAEESTEQIELKDATTLFGQRNYWKSLEFSG
jgi:PAS domain-containing protein